MQSECACPPSRRRSLVPYMKDPKTVFVISSDFCHWGDNFEFMPYDKSKGAIWESIKAMDLEGAGYIEKNDAEAGAEARGEA